MNMLGKTPILTMPIKLSGGPIARQSSLKNTVKIGEIKR
jgi:hypothetical protein